MLFTAMTMPLAMLVSVLSPPPPPPFQDGAGNRSEPLFFVPPASNIPGELPPRCNEARTWCAQARRGDSGWMLELSGSGGTQHIPLPASIVGSSGGQPLIDVWPRLFREADGSLLIGLHRMNGGGGRDFTSSAWSNQQLILVRLTPGGVTALLEVPMLNYARMRVCANARDQRSRSGACHNNYTFTAMFEMDARTASGAPSFALSTRARTSPGRLTRSMDSGPGPRLRLADLMEWVDPVCSDNRLYRLDRATGRYLPDQPVPACADYLAPR